MDVEIRGAAELNRVLGELPLNVEKNILRGALRAGARVIQLEARALTPVKSGDLRQSIRVRVNARGREIHARVIAGGNGKGEPFYAHLVERGTRQHLISAKGHDALSRKGTPLSIRSLNNRIKKGVLKIGDWFGLVVRHPGARAQPFMEPALDNKSGEAVERIREYIARRLSRLK